MDRTFLEGMLRRVADGELSVSEATTRLIDRPEEPAEPVESLRSLVARLGPPPPDVVAAWEASLERDAGDGDFGTRIPLTFARLDRDQWGVDATGQLRPRGGVGNRHGIDDAEGARDGEAVIDSVKSGLGDSVVGRGTRRESGTGTSTSTRRGRIGRTSARRGGRSGSRRRRRIVLLALAGLFGGVAVVGYRSAGFPRDDEGSASGSSRADATGSESGAASRSTPPSAADVDAGADVSPGAGLGPEAGSDRDAGSERPRVSDSTSGEDEPVELSTILEAGRLSSGEEIDLFAGLDREALRGEPAEIDFMPSGEQEERQAAGDLDGPESRNGSGSRDRKGEQAGESSAAVAGGNASPSFVTLEADLAVRLFEEVPAELRLAFPHEISLRLVSRGSGGGWDVEDSDGGKRVATIAAESGGVSLRWREGARRSAAGGLLRHGRLVTGNGRIVYLRPAVVADPIRLGLRSTDPSVGWDVGGGPPIRAATLEADMLLQDTIDVGWVEPIDLSNPRRGEGLAVLSLADDETVAVAVRIDFRWTRRLSVRLRYAARLDPGLPWQTITAETLESARRSFADRGVAIGARVAAIESAYERAGDRERRSIRPRRDAARRAAESIGVAVARMHTLDRLLSGLEEAGRLDVRAGVSWPDGRQPILTTRRGSEEPARESLR